VIVDSIGRRLVATALALAIATALFRSDVALAVVTRGDDALRAGNVAVALRFYRRALWLDESSTVAADRLSFYLALLHSDVAARESIATATRTLHRAPSGDLYADRALAELELHRWKQAEGDFVEAARTGRDPRYDHFAARMALRTGRRQAARQHERDALALDPAFSPAQTLMRNLR
jgi:tetratricopeptide (TPR) repeat protein